MKFESKFGLGEIVCTKQQQKGERFFSDSLFKIIGVTFALDGTKAYLVRLEDGHMTQFMESELIGDPDFNQESGYPDHDDDYDRESNA